MNSQVKAALIRARALIWRIRDILPRQRTSLERLRRDLSPVFVIGANRSGTSVVSSIMAQHPDLEGLFTGAQQPRYDDAGHSIGFCESMHVWPRLLPDDRYRRRQGHSPFWCTPAYVSESYREGARNDRERFDLAWAVQRLRQTAKQPLIKDQFNTLRVGLVNDVFPRARFVLVTRHWQDFAEHAIHKWRSSGRNIVLSADRPRVGLHWRMANLIVRYDLEAYARTRYAEIWLDSLHQGPSSARSTLDDLCAALNLSPFTFDLQILQAQWARRREHNVGSDEVVLGSVKGVVEYERKLLRSDDHEQPRILHDELRERARGRWFNGRE
jgi:hypothetical protein